VARGVAGERGSIEEVGVRSGALETNYISLDAVDEEPIRLDVRVTIA
jgi:hypothetical protein